MITRCPCRCICQNRTIYCCRTSLTQHSLTSKLSLPYCILFWDTKQMAESSGKVKIAHFSFFSLYRFSMPRAGFAFGNMRWLPQAANPGKQQQVSGLPCIANLQPSGWFIMPSLHQQWRNNPPAVFCTWNLSPFSLLQAGLGHGHPAYSPNVFILFNICLLESWRLPSF